MMNKLVISAAFLIMAFLCVWWNNLSSSFDYSIGIGGRIFILFAIYSILFAFSDTIWINKTLFFLPPTILYAFFLNLFDYEIKNVFGNTLLIFVFLFPFLLTVYFVRKKFKQKHT